MGNRSRGMHNKLDRSSGDIGLLEIFGERYGKKSGGDECKVEMKIRQEEDGGPKDQIYGVGGLEARPKVLKLT